MRKKSKESETEEILVEETDIVIDEEAEEEDSEEADDAEDTPDVDSEAGDDPEAGDDSETEEDSEEDDSEEDEDDAETDFGAEEEDPEEYKRRMRHSRRVKSQVISYSVIGLIVIIIAVGIFLLVRQIAGMVSAYTEKKQVEEEIADMTASEEEDITIEAPETETEETEETVTEESTDYVGDMAASVISEMTTEDKVAQLFMITPEALTGADNVTQAGDSTQEALNTYAVGGLIYDSSNIESADQVTEMLTKIQGMSKYELFLAVKEPGGETDAVASKISEVAPVEGPSEIAESGDSANAYSAGTTIAEYLSAFGFNTDISPCGDIMTDENSVSAKLCYGADESTASDMIAKMVQGLEEGSIHSCLTDFPGNGSITESTSDKTVESDVSSDVLSGQLVPYISGVAAGAQMIQMSNVTFTAADKSGVPASLSEYMIGTMLRGNMGFEGIVITGSLNEKAITENYSSGDAAVAAINAGADIIYEPENFADAYTAVLDAVNNGTISQDRLNEALEHIFRVKFADDVE